MCQILLSHVTSVLVYCSSRVLPFVSNKTVGPHAVQIMRNRPNVYFTNIFTFYLLYPQGLFSEEELTRRDNVKQNYRQKVEKISMTVHEMKTKIK